MNVGLVDRLACPRCGPPFGLILLAREVRDRRVLRGDFGCANCRDRFPVEDGFGDLRPPPRTPGAPHPGADCARTTDDAGAGAGDVEGNEADDPRRALRLAAMLGVTEGPGLVVLADRHRGEAAALARLVAGIEVLVVGWGGRGVAAGGVSAFATGSRMPLRDGVVRGAVAVGESGEGWWGECLRVIVPGGRIVITRATDEARGWMAAAGLATLLDGDGVVVGERGGGGVAGVAGAAAPLAPPSRPGSELPTLSGRGA